LNEYNGIHPTADTPALIKRDGSGRRAMPGVARPRFYVSMLLQPVFRS